MKHHLPSLLLILLLSLSAQGQQGQPFVTDIPFERSLGEVRVTRMIQGSDLSMLLCTERGVVSFDGTSWEIVIAPSTPLTLVSTEEGRVFVGMKKGAGELTATDSGTFRVRPLLPDAIFDPIHQILATEDHLFLINDSRMWIVELGSGEKAGVLEFGDRIFSGAFVQFGVLHLLFYQEGLYSYQNEQLTSIGNYRSLADHQLLFDLATAGGTYLGFENGDLYLSDGIKVSRVSGDLRKYLNDHRASDGLLLNDTLIAFATLAGGAVVVDRRQHSIVHTLDYSTGLPDNEITALGMDRNGGMWMAYGSGISRLDLLQPISRFHSYPGLKGAITTTAKLNGQLYVGTGRGVFILTETRDRAEIQRIIKQRDEDQERSAPEKTAPKPTPKPTALKQEEEKDKEDDLISRYLENPSEVKKELSRKELRELRKTIRKQKRNKGRNSQDDEEEEEPEEDPTEVEGPQQLESESTDSLQPSKTMNQQKVAVERSPKAASTRNGSSSSTSVSSTYIFRPVNGINVKCRELAVVDGHLFAATPNGLYRIRGEQADNLTPGVYVNHVSAAKDGTSALLATMSGPIRLSRKGQSWQADPLCESNPVNVYNVIEDSQGNIWAGADNAVLLQPAGNNDCRLIELTTESGHLEHVLVSELEGRVHLLLPNSFMRMDGNTPVPVSLPGIISDGRMEFYLDNTDAVWIRTDSEWHVLNGDGLEQHLAYLPLFEDVRHITSDGKGGIILVDESAEIYSITNLTGATSENAFNVFIRRALSEDRQPFGLGELTVRPGENSITFQLSAPFFLKSKATEYQYRVDGLKNNWSRWNTSSTVEIPFLPPGDYMLQVRARNVLGEISEVRTLAFTVLKPIWQRWYAILLYIVTLVGIFWLIIKAREKSLRETQRELEEKVQERTAELASEKEKTEILLLNILPRETAEELRKSGKATARHYNQVSVLFTDFKGFTRFAESTRPEDLVQELDRCFIAFDDIITKYHLEKIKTIGDAYMCAGGVPIRNTNNAVAIVLAALEIRDVMLRLQEEKKARNERFWEIRLGISTGPLTAGVVGKKKFAYDIWGDTVNTASRMESCSESGKVNISASTHELVKDYFDCTYRGKMDAKGKGEVDMYFVNGIRKEFSENGDGVTPNNELREIIA